MLLLQLPARDLLRLHERGLLISHLSQRHLVFQDRLAGPGDERAWQASLIELARDLVEVDRGDVRMFVEYQPTAPDGSEVPPMDVLLVGRFPDTDRDSVLIVELKQWREAVRSTADPTKYEVPGIKKPKGHPVQQVRRSYRFLTGHGGILHGLTIEIAGFSYLHNAEDEQVADLLDAPEATGGDGLCFTSDSRDDLRRLLLQRFAAGDTEAAAERMIDRIGIRNTPLLEAMMKSRGEDTVFTLRGAQQTVVDDVLRTLTRIYERDEQGKHVIVVTGGAGTGKSAIALELRNRLVNERYRVGYATGARAFQANLQEYLGMSDARFKRDFHFFNGFVDPPEPLLDVLLCDEAHRLRERSTFDGPTGSRRPPGTRPQVEELVDAARITVFFLDEAQSLRRDEVGTHRLIVEAAERMEVPCRTYPLTEYHRCGGSTLYRNWVWDLLGIDGGSPRPWVPDGLMHVEVADEPRGLERIILEEDAAGASARMVAGFCWKWSDARADGTLVADVRIGDWHRSWNARGEMKEFADRIPPAKLWATRPEGRGQIGCVYSAQGLEWDWCGVIMGDDLVRRGDRWVMRKGKFRERDDGEGYDTLAPGSADPRVSGDRGIGFEQRVRHAYHVLMTRAARATVLYSTDPETQEFLRSVVPPVDIHGLRPSQAAKEPADRTARRLPSRRKPRTGQRSERSAVRDTGEQIAFDLGGGRA
ncbi:DUF2075 domain-containing protein [Kitasatospora purpeofusca]|uniref:DUF2075 domain-containing protein n=1 Tax=Kitasatospora purpeofusca TaxID=67352 RepID=UPI00340BBF5C